MYTILSVIGIGTIVYNYEKIKLFAEKQIGTYRANEIVFDFFVELINDFLLTF